MPQSLSKVVVHLVFSTLDRVPCLTEEVQHQLFAYLAGILKNNGHVTISVGGHTDHVHLLFAQSKIESLSKTVETLKTSSSKWLKTEFSFLGDFHWQAGYGAFSVSSNEKEAVLDYIRNQHFHHKTLSFQDELRQLLGEAEIVFDEQYVWG